MKERIKATGITPREEKIINGRRILQSDFNNDPQYNEYVIDYHSKQPIDIKMYDEKYTNSYGITVKFQTKHIDVVECGSIFYDTRLNEYWLCLESALVGDIYYEGKLAKCNRLLKWQESDGNIYEIPVVNRNASQYNNGEKGNSTITLASDQLFIYTQLNKHTVILDHGIKFFIDENRENPTVYKLTRPDTIDYSYMGIGMMGMIVTECAYSPTKKELEQGICDYQSPTSFPSPPDEKTDLSALISCKGSEILKAGGNAKIFSVSFTDAAGDPVNDIHYTWEATIADEFKDCIIMEIIPDNRCRLKVSYDTMIVGNSVKLAVKDMDGKEIGHKIIEIGGGL